MSCQIDKYYKRNIDYKISDLAYFCQTSTVTIYAILDSKHKPNVYLALKIFDFFNIYIPDRARFFQLSDYFIYDQETL